MAHKHKVIDEDKDLGIVLMISTDDQDIHLFYQGEIVDDEYGPIQLVQGDHNSERISFQIPLEEEGHRFSDCDKIEIHYINIGRNGEQSPGIYEVPKADIHSDDPDDEAEPYLYFDWLISDVATRYEGSLHFMVRFLCLDNNNVEYAWNTKVYSNVVVDPTINNSSAIVERYGDILDSWYQHLIKAGNAGVDMVTNATNNGIELMKLETDRYIKESALSSVAEYIAENVPTQVEEYVDENLDTVITDALGNIYAKKSDVESTYATKEELAELDISGKLKDYATKEELDALDISDKLVEYATKEDLENGTIPVKASTAASATNATNATYAINDAEGNTIRDTYATRDELIGGEYAVHFAYQADKAEMDINGMQIHENYATKDEVKALDIDSYATIEGLGQGSYYVSSAYYADRADMDINGMQIHEHYATKDEVKALDIDSYAKTEDITNGKITPMQAEIAYKDRLSNGIVETYATKDELTDYAATHLLENGTIIPAKAIKAGEADTARCADTDSRSRSISGSYVRREPFCEGTTVPDGQPSMNHPYLEPYSLYVINVSVDKSISNTSSDIAEQKYVGSGTALIYTGAGVSTASSSSFMVYCTTRYTNQTNIISSRGLIARVEYSEAHYGFVIDMYSLDEQKRISIGNGFKISYQRLDLSGDTAT